MCRWWRSRLRRWMRRSRRRRHRGCVTLEIVVHSLVSISSVASWHRPDFRIGLCQRIPGVCYPRHIANLPFWPPLKLGSWPGLKEEAKESPRSLRVFIEARIVGIYINNTVIAQYELRFCSLQHDFTPNLNKQVCDYDKFDKATAPSSSQPDYVKDFRDSQEASELRTRVVLDASSTRKSSE